MSYESLLKRPRPNFDSPNHALEAVGILTHRRKEASFAFGQNDRPAFRVGEREKPKFLLPRVLVVLGLIDTYLVLNDLPRAFVVLGHYVPGEAVSFRHSEAGGRDVVRVTVARGAEFVGASFVEAASLSFH